MNSVKRDKALDQLVALRNKLDRQRRGHLTASESTLFTRLKAEIKAAESEAPEGLSQEEYDFAMETPVLRLDNSELHDQFQLEDQMLETQERINDLRTDANANRHALQQCGYGLLLQTIDGLQHDSPEWAIERSEGALSEAIVLSNNQLLGIY